MLKEDDIKLVFYHSKMFDWLRFSIAWHPNDFLFFIEKMGKMGQNEIK